VVYHSPPSAYVPHIANSEPFLLVSSIKTLEAKYGDETAFFLACNSVPIGSQLPKFRDNLPAPYPLVNQSTKNAGRRAEPCRT